MSNEQTDNDTLVSATYRDSAQETTPPELDEAVLRMAARNKRADRNDRFSAWMRPLTWTVTAGLCVVLVMNIPEVERDMPATAPESVTPAESIEEAFAAEDADVVQEAEKMASVRDGLDQPAPLARARQEQAKRLDKDQADSAVESRAYTSGAAVSADSVAQEMALEKKESARETACDEASRNQADSWYDCVLELRDLGRTDDADREMLELVEQFPNFQPE